MDFVDNILKRVNLQQICVLFLSNTDDIDIDNDNCKNRLEKGKASINKRLKAIYSNADEFDEAVTDLSEALVAYSEVYTEIGMKLGARMLYQLLLKNDFSEIDKTN